MNTNIFQFRINRTFLRAMLFLFLTTPIVAQDTLTIAFGSCNKAEEDQSYWTNIAAEQAQAWIWLGDIVYADTKKPAALKKKYKELKCNTHYATFSQSHDIYGIWDDHDYGDNDGGKDYKIKKKSKQILFNFLEVPKTNPAQKRIGAHQSHIIQSNGMSIKLILLDTRYFRDKLKADLFSVARYIPDVKAEILGEAQWIWLEKELAESTEDVILIASGTQIIPMEHPYEKWADYPKERTRMLDLLRKYKEKRMVLLSGDRHMAEVSAMAIDASHFLYEITASGMTHTWSKANPEANSFRIKNMFPKKNYATLHLSKSNDEIHLIAELKAIDGSLLDSYELYPQ